MNILIKINPNCTISQVSELLERISCIKSELAEFIDEWYLTSKPTDLIQVKNIPDILEKKRYNGKKTHE